MKKNLKKSLNELKFGKNKNYLIHVSLIDLGLLEDLEPEKTCSYILSVIKKLTPKKSTYYTMSPLYKYSTNKIIFDKNSKKISKEIGNFAKYLISFKNSVRSNNPIFNLCAVGPNSKKIFKDSSPTSFGFDSAWYRLFKKNCEMIFIGCDLSKCTFIRFIEFSFGVPYIYNKFFNIPIKENKTKIQKFSINQLRYLNGNIEYNTKKFENLLIKKKVLKKSRNKKFNFMRVNMKDAFKIGIQELSKNPFFFLKKKPHFSKKFSPYN